MVVLLSDKRLLDPSLDKASELWNSSCSPAHWLSKTTFTRRFKNGERWLIFLGVRFKLSIAFCKNNYVQRLEIGFAERPQADLHVRRPETAIRRKPTTLASVGK